MLETSHLATTSWVVNKKKRSTKTNTIRSFIYLFNISLEFEYDMRQKSVILLHFRSWQHRVVTKTVLQITVNVLFLFDC